MHLSVFMSCIMYANIHVWGYMQIVMPGSSLIPTLYEVEVLILNCTVTNHHPIHVGPIGYM